MIRALIVDDESPARLGIRIRLEREPDIRVVGEVGDGPAAVAAIRELTPDLVFLDIQMPGLDGFGVLDALEPVEWPPAVIFVTAFDRHAVRAFDTHAIDYVVKPLVDRRFQRALERSREALRRQAAIAHHEALASFLAENPVVSRTFRSGSRAEESPNADPLERLAVRTGNRVRFVDVSDVHWFEGARNYVRLHLDGETLLARTSMRELLDRLPSDRFQRTHRSYIVSLGRIREIIRGRGDRAEIIMESGARVPLSKTYRQAVLRRF